MRNIIPSLLSLFALVLFACPKLDPGQGVDITEDALMGCWMHAYEEEKGESGKIYRPCDFRDFPPSRFRDSMEFMIRGECSYKVLASNDAHHMAAGRWEYLEATKQVKIYDADGKVVKSLQIIKVGDDILVWTE